MAQIGQYTILPLAIPATPAFPKPTTHTIYLQPHAPKVPTSSDERSIFLVNVPVDSTSAHLRAIFVSLVGVGRFESVTFEHEKGFASAAGGKVVAKPGSKKRKRGDEDSNRDAEQLPPIWDRELRRSGSTAVVVLADRKSVEGVLKAVRKLHKDENKGKGAKWPVWGEGVEEKVPSLGSARYLARQKLRYPNVGEVQRAVDAFMTGFNQRESEREREDKRKRNEPDEDGFITVSRGGRVGPARMEEVERKRVEMEEKERKKREEMGGFYRFQMRERRKAEQGELVKRFEEDKKRVEKMRGERKGRFRPEN